jgi:hypothetical protein
MHVPRHAQQWAVWLCVLGLCLSLVPQAVGQGRGLAKGRYKFANYRCDQPVKNNFEANCRNLTLAGTRPSTPGTYQMRSSGIARVHA